MRKTSREISPKVPPITAENLLPGRRFWGEGGTAFLGGSCGEEWDTGVDRRREIEPSSVCITGSRSADSEFVCAPTVMWDGVIASNSGGEVCIGDDIPAECTCSLGLFCPNTLAKALTEGNCSSGSFVRVVGNTYST